METNLHVPALFPDDYLPDVHMRLILYKRVSAAVSGAELDELQVELIDRFGLLPAAAKNLLRIASIKLSAKSLGIRKISASTGGGFIEFGEQTAVDPVALVQLVQNEPQIYRMKGAGRLQFQIELEDEATRFEHIEKLLDILAAGTVQSSQATG